MSYVLLETDGPVGIVTLNNPDKHNAFDDVLISELTTALRTLDANSSVRVVILSAVGKSFSAGADLNWMKRMAGYSHAENLRDAEALGRLMSTLHALSKPTIARLQGAAYGGGVGLAASVPTAMSQQAASPTPPPYAAPCRRAIFGLDSACSVLINRPSASASRRFSACE